MFWQILETLVMVWCCPRSPLLKRTWKENIFINHICTAGANSNISWAALLVVKWTQKVNRTTLGESSTATIVLINESLRSKQKKEPANPSSATFQCVNLEPNLSYIHLTRCVEIFWWKKILVLHLLNDIGYWNF